jgi:predicted N-acetyltransferase YhbS
MRYTSRPYAGAADLRLMQAAVSDAYATTTLRVGDVAWVSRYHTHRELSFAIRLWEDPSGRLIGWSYFRAFGGFNLFVAPGCAEAGLLDEMLAVVEAAAEASARAGDPPLSLYTYAIDVTYSEEDRALAAALERHGFQEQPGVTGVLMRSLERLPTPVVPAGYRLDWVQTHEHLLGRVEAQRAAFAPSDLLLERYLRVQQRWPYRPELDRIVVADDGTVVAFCLSWIDEQNAAGLLEPVGTRPDHQRRGLARAVCLDALHALRGAGARTAQVGYGSEAGRATYTSLGFEHLAADTVYRREPR